MNLNMHGKTTKRKYLKYYVSINRVSIPKYRVNSNIYQFRPPKRAHLADLSTDSVALANVFIINDLSYKNNLFISFFSIV